MDQGQVPGYVLPKDPQERTAKWKQYFVYSVYALWDSEEELDKVSFGLDKLRLPFEFQESHCFALIVCPSTLAHGQENASALKAEL